MENYDVPGEATWTENTVAGSGQIVITNANRARANATLPSIQHIDNWTPSSADYSIAVDVVCITTPTALGNQVGIGVRTGTTAYTGHFAYLETWTVDGGVGWRIALWRAAIFKAGLHIPPPVPGQTYRLILTEIGNNVTVYWDDEVVIEYTMAGADIISVVGTPAIVMAGSAAFISNTTGLHFDNLLSAEGSIPNTPFVSTNVSFTAADLQDNSYDGTGDPKQQVFSRLVLNTNATKLRVMATTDLWSAYPNWCRIGIRVNGSDLFPMTMYGNSTRSVRFNFASGPKTVELVPGLQNGFASIQETDLIGVEVNPGAAFNIVPPPAVVNRILAVGDSITVGANAFYPESAGWTMLLRNTYGRNIMVEGYGGRALWNDCVDAAARTAFAAKLSAMSPSIVWIALGTNDYGLNRWGASNFGIAYADLLDKFHAILPSVTVYCQSPLQRGTETANAFGSTLGDYRTQISTAASARSSYCIYVEGGAQAIVSTANLDADLVHPTTAGHAQYAGVVNGILP